MGKKTKYGPGINQRNRGRCNVLWHFLLHLSKGQHSISILPYFRLLRTIKSDRNVQHIYTDCPQQHDTEAFFQRPVLHPTVLTIIIMHWLQVSNHTEKQQVFKIVWVKGKVMEQGKTQFLQSTYGKGMTVSTRKQQQKQIARQMGKWAPFTHYSKTINRKGQRQMIWFL